MTEKLLTVPPATETVLEGAVFSRVWWRFVSRVTAILSGGEPVKLKAYAVASLPPAADWPRCTVVVTDDIDGEVPAWSDGTTWRRVTDRAEVSTT